MTPSLTSKKKKKKPSDRWCCHLVRVPICMSIQVGNLNVEVLWHNHGRKGRRKKDLAAKNYIYIPPDPIDYPKMYGTMFSFLFFILSFILKRQ